MVSTNEVDGVKIRIDLDASDSLSVRLKSIRVEGPARKPMRLRDQARTIVDRINYLDGELSLIEVDGFANAVQIRTKNPEPIEGGVRFVEVVLREGNLITVEAKGAPIHLSQERMQKLTDALVQLVR